MRLGSQGKTWSPFAALADLQRRARKGKVSSEKKVITNENFISPFGVGFLEIVIAARGGNQNQGHRVAWVMSGADAV